MTSVSDNSVDKLIPAKSSLKNLTTKSCLISGPKLSVSHVGGVGVGWKHVARKHGVARQVLHHWSDH